MKLSLVCRDIDSEVSICSGEMWDNLMHMLSQLVCLKEFSIHGKIHLEAGPSGSERGRITKVRSTTLRTLDFRCSSAGLILGFFSDCLITEVTIDMLSLSLTADIFPDIKSLCVYGMDPLFKSEYIVAKNRYSRHSRHHNPDKHMPEILSQRRNLRILHEPGHDGKLRFSNLENLEIHKCEIWENVQTDLFNALHGQAKDTSARNIRYLRVPRSLVKKDKQYRLEEYVPSLVLT